MKITSAISKGLVVTLLAVLYSMAVTAQTPRQLLKGDYADPTVMRDGKDFYMTHSSFFYGPGLLIWHSTDMVNWTPIANAVGYDGYSIFAPEILKHDGRYYIYYPTSTGENYVVWADNVRGPWSKPVKLDVRGIDPGHIVGEDGRRYLFLNNGWIVPLSDDGLSVAGEAKKVYDGWRYPTTWETEGDNMWLESPKLIRRKGYFYMTSAEGGTAGPPTSHMCVSARSKSVYGPWENSPYNPSVHTYSKNEPWWSRGHGTVIDDADGNWWIIYHAYAKNMHTLGRQTLIEPVKWKSDDWYVADSSKVAIAGECVMPDSEFDFTKTDRLPLTLTFWKEYALESLHFSRKGLKVDAKGSGPQDARMILQTAGDECYEVETEVEVSGENRGGMILFYNEKAFSGLMSDGNELVIYDNGKVVSAMKNAYGKRFRIKIGNVRNKMTIWIASAKKKSRWNVVAEDVDVSTLNHNVHGGFFALRPAIVAEGDGQVGFRHFKYKKTN